MRIQNTGYMKYVVTKHAYFVLTGKNNTISWSKSIKGKRSSAAWMCEQVKKIKWSDSLESR